MRALLFFALLFCCMPPVKAKQPVLHLTEKILGERINDGWRYFPGDDPPMAQPGYNDSAWLTVSPELNLANDTIARSFKGICWLRLHFDTDSMVGNALLALDLRHAGASEIYLDGKLLTRFGTINGADSSEYENPTQSPYVFRLSGAGPHLLAIRYANYDALHDYHRYSHDKAGFRCVISEANDRVSNVISQMGAIMGIFMLLAGIFATLGFLHLVMYCYLRSDISNLYFSGFCFSICGCIFFPVLITICPDPWQIKGKLLTVICCTLACGTLTGFINVLFSRRKKVARIVLIICGINCLLVFFSYRWAAGVAGSLVAIVAVMAMITIISGIVRKIEGARIIGAGFLLLLSLIILILLLSLIQRGYNISLNNTVGQIWVLLIAIAILSMPASFSIFLAARYAKVSRSLKEQLLQVQLLSEKTVAQEAEKQRSLQDRQAELEAEVSLRTAQVVQQKNEIESQHAALKIAKKKSDDLLLNILPEEVAEELKETGRAEAKLYEEVSVLFTDFVNFTTVSELLSPAELVAEIDHCFKGFDDIMTRFGLEKIKTIGDAYMAVCGLPVRKADHAQATVDAGLAIRDFMEQRKLENPLAFSIRIGIHSGPVVAGIVGVKKFAYDIWGDTVNTAARMEQHGAPGKVNISGATYGSVATHFVCTHRGALEAKHKGKLDMYFAEPEGSGVL